MKQITAYIESNGKDLFSIYTEEKLAYFVIGDGVTIEEAKADFLAVYEASRKAHLEETGLDVQYSFAFELTASAFFLQYKGLISLAGLSKLTGINKAQLSQYACGTRKPTAKTLQKIKDSIHSLGLELCRAFA